MAETYDVVIAGGAAMGSSTAFHLAADPGFSGRVLVVEKDSTYQRAASALSGSSIRQQFSTAINIRASLFGIEFLRQAPDLLAVDGEKADIRVRENGYLYLASEAGAGVLAEIHVLQSAEGADIVLMDRDALQRRFPFLETGDLAAASWGRTREGWFDGYTLTQAFRKKARSLGVSYREAKVVGVTQQGGRVTQVHLDDGETIGCGAFVNCAGVSGARALAQACGFDLPIESRKRTVFRFTCPTMMPDMPLVIDVTGVWVRPEGDGYIAGGVPENDVHCEDFDVDWPQFDEQVWPSIAHRIPAFEQIRPGGAWAGHYDMNVFDHNAIVGRMPGLDNGYFAAGFSGHGIQQSPAIGRGLAELVAHGRYVTLDLSDFAFGRIAAGRKILEKNVI